jgi:hypothetical protein
MYLAGRQASPPKHREPEELPPIAEGRFAAWVHQDRARAQVTIAAIHSPTDVRCLLPDGSIGRVAIVSDGSGLTVVCEVARLHPVRGKAGAGSRRA